MSKKVIINIKDGNVSADFEGFHGKQCEQLAQRIHPGDIEEAEKTLKPEYHVTTQSETQGY